jgi:hypothetical protein
VSETCLPSVGERLGNRTVICVKSADCIIFGVDERDVTNCGAYITNLREWLDFERRVQCR